MFSSDSSGLRKFQEHSCLKSPVPWQQSVCIEQRSEVCDLCHTYLHDVPAKSRNRARFQHVRFQHAHRFVCCCIVQNGRQNLICLVCIIDLFLHSFSIFLLRPWPGYPPDFSNSKPLNPKPLVVGSLISRLSLAETLHP